MKMDHLVRLNGSRLMMPTVLVKLELSWRFPDQGEDLRPGYLGAVKSDLLFIDSNHIMFGVWQRFFFEGEDFNVDHFEKFFPCRMLVHGGEPSLGSSTTIP